MSVAIAAQGHLEAAGGTLSNLSSMASAMKAQGQKARKATKAMKGAPFMWSKSWQTVFRGRSGRLNVDELVNLQIDFGSCKVTETWKRHG